MSDIALLLVTCCLDDSRSNLLRTVIENLDSQLEGFRSTLTVFDNASTNMDVKQLCESHNITNVFKASRNVGYWSAIDWWLRSLETAPPKFTYIIESDMVHYRMNLLTNTAKFLDDHPDVGSVRLHQYSVADRHLFNKDKPTTGSKTNLWQSHTNKVTGQPVSFKETGSEFWITTFLTQLPALNRYDLLLNVFEKLCQKESFTEFDFQSMYWEHSQKTGILDGGMFHCDLNPYGTEFITGSWSSERVLASLGYQTTRKSSIADPSSYTVVKV